MIDENPRRPASGGVAPTYTIFLRDFSAAVVLRGEDTRRPAHFNVRLTVAHPGPDFADDIAAVMSYEPIVQDLRRLCADERPSGAEELAERAASLCLKQPEVSSARVEVELPDRTTGAVAGITVFREQSERI